MRLWRAVHWLAYAVWPLAAVHGIGAAADLQSGVLLDVVLATIAGVLVAIAWRFGPTVQAAATAWPDGGCRRPAQLAASGLLRNGSQIR